MKNERGGVKPQPISMNGDIAGTLDASYYKGPGERGGIEREIIAEVIPLEGNGQRPSHKGDGYSECDKMYTLNTVEQHAVAYEIAKEVSD